MRRDIAGLYVVKFLCIMLIIGIHTTFPFEHQYILQFSRIGVPIFFMISGFFVMREGIQDEKEYLLKSIFKMLKILAGAYLLYFAWFSLCNFYSLNELFIFIKDNYNKLLVGFVRSGGGYGYHLWYIASYIHVLLIYLFSIRFKLKKYLFLFIPIGLCLNFVLGKYHGLFFDGSFVPEQLYHRNALTVGMPFFLLGGLLRRYSHYLSKIRRINLWILLMIGLQLVEFWIQMWFGFNGEGDINIMTIPLSIGVFIWGYNLDCSYRIYDMMQHCGKKYTQDIYIYHLLLMFILSTLVYFFPVLGIFHKYFFVVLASLLLATIIELCRKWSIFIISDKLSLRGSISDS